MQIKKRPLGLHLNTAMGVCAASSQGVKALEGESGRGPAAPEKASPLAGWEESIHTWASGKTGGRHLEQPRDCSNLYQRLNRSLSDPVDEDRKGG